MTWNIDKTILQLRCSKCGHVLVTTFEDCPEEDPLCPKGCGGSIRVRPDPAARKKRAKKKE